MNEKLGQFRLKIEMIVSQHTDEVEGVGCADSGHGITPVRPTMGGLA